MGRVPIVMRTDGSISAIKATDLREVAERDERIRQLEKQCEVLSAEVDAQRPIVEACEIAVRDGAIGTGYGPHLRHIYEAVREYQASNPK